MVESYDLIRNEMRSCIKRGLPLPARPDPINLWDALGGDGYLALVVMLEFEAAEREVKLEQQERALRERVFRSRVAA